MENDIEEWIKNDANVVYMSLVSQEGVAKDRKIYIFGSILAWFWHHFGALWEQNGVKIMTKWHQNDTKMAPKWCQNDAKKEDFYGD